MLLSLPKSMTWKKLTLQNALAINSDEKLFIQKLVWPLAHKVLLKLTSGSISPNLFCQEKSCLSTAFGKKISPRIKTPNSELKLVHFSPIFFCLRNTVRQKNPLSHEGMLMKSALCVTQNWKTSLSIQNACLWPNFVDLTLTHYGITLGITSVFLPTFVPEQGF